MKTLFALILLGTVALGSTVAQQGPEPAEKTPPAVAGGKVAPHLAWDKVEAEPIKRAIADKKPIVVFFPKEGTDVATYLSGDAYVALKKEAQFLYVPIDAARGPESEEPACPLLCANPWAAYGIKDSEESIIILDWFGNYEAVGMKYCRKPTATELEKGVARVRTQATSMQSKIDKHLADANASINKADFDQAFNLAMKILDLKVVGYTGIGEARLIYRAVCDDVLQEVAELAEDDSAAAREKLEALARVYTTKRAADVAAKIAEALKGR
ncbi:MAG: hypothetical protein IT462_13670 [Planctomycetes bacterium]|nr:hypothetical protein [Planctomycetota bacterium]